MAATSRTILLTSTENIPATNNTQVTHAIGLTKVNYLDLGHAAVGVLGREAVGVLMGRPRLSHHVNHCVAPPAAAIGLLILMTRFSLARLMSCSGFQV